MNDEELAFAPLARLADMIAAGALDPVRLTELYLERIRHYDGALQAYVEVFREDALTLAKAAAVAQKAKQPLGRLHGVPIAIKDLFDIAGSPSGAGSRRRQAPPPPRTAPVVERLRAAGAVILGRTHMVELAFGAWGTNAATGTPRNPWDARAHRVAGGSSSGSGVAVAAALAPAALGSDTGGSVRIPAAMCGVVGLKTTHGRITTESVVPLSTSLDTIGPLTRTVEDAGLLLEILADDYAGGRPSRLAAALARGTAGLRLGIAPEAQLGTIDAGVRQAFAGACERLRRLGAEVVEVAFPDAFFGTSGEMQTIIAAEAYAANEALFALSGPAFDPHVEARLLRGKGVSAAQYIHACARRRAHQAEMLEFFADFAALLTPTTAIPARTLAEVDETSPVMARLTRPVNYLGLSALALPCGLDGDGLPLSFQIIGRPWQEELLLRIGKSYEQAAPAMPRPALAAFLAEERR